MPKEPRMFQERKSRKSGADMRTFSCWQEEPLKGYTEYLGTLGPAL